MTSATSPSPVRETQGFRDNGPRARAIRCLREWINDGALPDGQPLPAERELAEQLQVNRGTLRSALQHLSDEGFLRSNGGRLRIVTLPTRVSSGLLQDVIAVLTDDGGEVIKDHRQPGWMDYLTQGSIQAIRGAGLHALVLHPEKFNERSISSLATDVPRGALLTCAGHSPAYHARMAAQLKRSGVHVVLHGDDESYMPFDRVTSDHEAGAYALTRWLLDQGKTNIINFWPEPAEGYWFAGRRRGYEQAMTEAGLTPMPTVTVPYPTLEALNVEDFQRNTRHLAGYLAEHLGGPGAVEALLLASDGFYPATAAACRLFGKEPGRDVLIAGYDNYWEDLPQREFEPSVPSVTVDKVNQKVGNAMLQLLLQRSGGKLKESVECRRIEPELIIPAELGGA